MDIKSKELSKMDFKTTITKKGLEFGVQCRLDGSLWVSIDNESLGGYNKFEKVDINNIKLFTP